MPLLSPDHFRFDSLPEDAATCPVCGAPDPYECPCDSYFADPDEEMYP